MVTGTLTGFIYSVTFSTNSMVHLRSSLISLAYAFGASAVNIASRSIPAQIKECLSGDAAETKTIKVEDSTLTFKTAPCPAIVEFRRAAASKRSPEIISTLVRRPISDCTIPQICECGFPCENIQCATLNEPVPVENDCFQLSLALARMEPNAFTVLQGSAASLSGGTCEMAVINEAIGNIQYCPGDLGIHGLAVAQQCIAENLDAGLCTLSDNHAEVFVLNSAAA